MVHVADRSSFQDLDVQHFSPCLRLAAMSSSIIDSADVTKAFTIELPDAPSCEASVEIVTFNASQALPRFTAVGREVRK